MNKHSSKRQAPDNRITPPQQARHRKFIPGDYVSGPLAGVFRVTERSVKSANALGREGRIQLVSSALTDTDNGW